MKDIHTIEFANLIFRGLTKEILFRPESDIKIVIPINAELIVLANEDEKFKRIINENYAVFDGQIPYVIAKIKNRNSYIKKISGSGFIYDICNYSKINKKRIFLLGGFKESNKISIEKIRMLGIETDGFSPTYKPYPFEKEHNEDILKRIGYFGPDFLFVGFGARKQEFWINENKQALRDIGVKCAIGCGGTFEMFSGKYKRCPKSIQMIGFEGVYRFIIEPKWFRLKRLFISFKMFKYL